MTPHVEKVVRMGLNAAAAPLWAAALAAAAFIAMDATIKSLAPRYGAVQLTVFRFASGAVYAIAIWAAFRTPMPTAGHWRPHLLRSALLMLTLVLYFQALSMLTLAQAVAMGYTAPIFISLLAIPLLHERPSGSIWAALALGFAGAGIALWPALLAGARPQLAGMAFAGLSAMTFALVMVLTRRQAQRNSLPTFLLLQNLMPLALLALPAAWLWKPVQLADLPTIAAAGALATLGLAAITWALARMEASRLAPVEYTGFIWAALIGFLAFNEMPTAYTAASAALIVSACLLLVRR